MRIITLLLLILFAHNTFAGEPLKNGLTLKLAIIWPESEFGKFNNGLGQPNSNGLIPYQQLYASKGLGMQFGHMFFLSSLNEDETMKLGLDVTWMGISYQDVKNTVNYDENSGDSQEKIVMHHLVGYFEVGPSFSYSPVESMAIDVAFKLTPTIGVIGGGDTKNARPVEGENWIIGTGFGLRYTPALYFRYSILLVGVEYSLGNLSYNYNIQNYGHRSYPSEYQSGTSPYSTLRIVTGFKF